MSQVRNLIGEEHSMSLNETNTMGVMTVDRLTTNQTRTVSFSSTGLVEWAKAVEEAYDGDPVDVMFAPERPIVAVKGGESNDASLGIGLAHRLPPVGDDE